MRAQDALDKPKVAPPASMPLHERIYTDLAGKIMSGEWPPGFKIPKEIELMVQYSCARMTVSKAISGLVSAGLIVRKKRAGSFVTRPRAHHADLELPDIGIEITERGDVHGLELLSWVERSPTETDQEAMSVSTGRILELRCLHLANGRPYAVEERLINLAIVPEAAKLDFSKVSPGTWLLTYVPWTEAENQISSINADYDLARLLDVPIGQACLLLERWTWRSSEKITYVRLYFSGRNYRLKAHFRAG